MQATRWLDWAGLSALSGVCAAVLGAAARPWGLKYRVSVTTFATLFFVGSVGVLRHGGRRMQGLEWNEFLLKDYPYRSDTPGYQVRTEPFRWPTKPEADEILKNPKQL